MNLKEFCDRSNEKIRRWFLTAFAFISVSISPAQNLTVAFHEGFIWAHTPKIRHLVTGYVPAFEFNYSLPANGTKSWHRSYNYPEYGIEFQHQDLRNPLLGKSYSLIPFIDYPLTKGSGSKLWLRSGLGLGYLTKHFDPDVNFQNNAIGTHINGAVKFDLDYRFDLSKKLRASTGLTFTHFSNAAHSFVNLGINVTTVRVGLSWRGERGNGKQKTENGGETTGNGKRETGGKEKRDERFFVPEIFVGGAGKAYTAGHNKIYPVGVTGLRLVRRFSEKSGFSLNADWFYSGVLARGLGNGSDTANAAAEAWRGGLSAHYLIYAGKLSYTLGMGAYVYSPYKGHGPLYHRLGFFYEISPRFKAMVTMKTHWAIAHNMEFGLSIRL